jgi:iron-sulfur cluster repair protein YtfE (RIC family)
MNAIDVLKKQHREVEKLFKQTLKTENPRERRELLDTIKTKLEAHTTIEEEIFYPAFKDVGTKKAEEMTMEAVEEHHVVKLVLGELPDVDPESETFDAKMTVLSELVDHHVQEEQDEMFPMAEKKLDDETLAQLGQRLVARTAALTGEGEPPRTRRSA